MARTVRECFSALQERFKDVNFAVGDSGMLFPYPHKENAFVIDKNILEQMAEDPKAAKEYEQQIALILEIQKAFSNSLNKEVKDLGKKLIVLQ